MEELNCVIGPCLAAFEQNPLGVATMAVFGSIALLSLYKMAAKHSMRSRIRWSYPLVFSLLFIVTYFSFSMVCHASTSLCSDHAILYSIPSAIIGALLFGYIILPRIYLAWSKGRLSEVLSKYLPESVPVYVADSGKPYAFSYGGFKRWIVVSQGMIDVLSKKELHAVLLHEYGHLTVNSSLYKASRVIYSKIPVLHAFLDGRKLDDEEEIRADAFAARAQGTAKYLDSAKRKLENYFGC